MKTSHPISHKILKRIQGSGRGSVFITADFSALGSRAAVDQALSRLARQGRVQRLKAGIYYFPTHSRLLKRDVAAAPEKVAAAIARKNGWTVEASGATAANQLGLSTQVPARIVLRTDGSSRTIDVGGWKIELRHTVPRFLGRGRHSPRLLQGLRWMGPNGITPETIRHLKSSLPTAAKAELMRDLAKAPLWLQPKLREIAG